MFVTIRYVYCQVKAIEEQTPKNIEVYTPNIFCSKLLIRQYFHNLSELKSVCNLFTKL